MSEAKLELTRSKAARVKAIAEQMAAGLTRYRTCVTLQAIDVEE